MSVDLARALEYPYESPSASFVFRAGCDVESFDELADVALLEGRTAVLAVGSNAAPAQLERKFPRAPDVIPVVRADVIDHDVVYAARFAPYGAVPGTLLRQAGTVVHLHVTFLTEGQIAAMDRTERVGEGAYELVAVPAGDVRLPVQWRGPIVTYRASAGPLIWKGTRVALAAVRASGRVLPALTEQQLLEELAGAVGMDLPSFVAKLVADDAWRRDRGDWLAGLDT